MRALVLFSCALALPAASVAQSRSFDYVPWQRVLDAYVSDAGRVDYAALKAHPQNLEQFVAELGSTSPVSSPQMFPSREDQMAYWINAYNALVMYGVVQAWPVESVLKIGILPHSFFWGRKFRVGGQEITLDHIEKDLLRKQFGDARIHFAINCASLSCPPLLKRAYMPATLDEQLDAAARAFVNSSIGVQTDTGHNRISLSRIFAWYGSDFNAWTESRGLRGPGSGAWRVIRNYADAPLRGQLDALHNPEVRYFDYDWGVNDVHAAAR